MRQATRALVGSCEEVLSAYCELQRTLKSLKSLAGKPGQRRSYKRLKEIGMTMLLTPTPEPFSDIIGISVLGIAKYLEWRSPPLTLSDVGEEIRTTFKNMRLF
ncbi:MAG: hypothetical protein QXU75_06820 [Candidatus Methanomethylicaceae archaeon]